MTASDQHRDRLVDHLETLVKREDRATLALLRGTLQEGRVLEGLSVVLPFLTPHGPSPNRAEDDALLLAALFALHPESGTQALPAALRTVAQTSDSVELRFRALLSANRQDLPTHLRHAVSLAASHGIAVDFRDLHTAIRFWEHPSDRTRRQWARAFWTPDNAGEPIGRPA